MNESEYRGYPMFCFNCGTLIEGYKDKNGKIKYICSKCKTSFVRSLRTRRKELIEAFAPKGEVRI